MANSSDGDSISAIVVTYWTGPCLRECLESLAAQQGLAEIIVVDNGNDAAARAWLEEKAAWDPKFRLLTPGRNIGFAAGCNFGASGARGHYLAFANPDLLVPAGTLAEVRAILGGTPGAWLCGARLLNVDGTEQRGGRREILSPWRAFVEATGLNRLFPNHPYFKRLHLHEQEALTEVVEVPTVSGAFMMMAKDRYEAIGGMDDNLFLHFDDADLCIRIRQAGGKVLYCGTVPVYHHLSTSDVARIYVEWHKTRSTSYYFHKHFRATYPVWVLTATSLLLWLRFLVRGMGSLPKDIDVIVRHWLRRPNYRQTSTQAPTTRTAAK